MRFRFCGDLDAPDWLLAEIVTLSRISSVRMKVVVKQVLRFLLTGELDSEKVLKLTKESLSGGKGASDLKGALAALDFVITSAAKYDVEHDTLQEEIQQLGLPKENSEAITKQYRSAKEQLRRRLAEGSYRVNRLVDTEWKIDALAPSSATEGRNDSAGPLLQLKFSVDERSFQRISLPSGVEELQKSESAEEGDQGGTAARRVRKLSVEMSADRLNVLYRELSRARELMRTVGS